MEKLRELLKGPSSPDPAEQLEWLLQVQEAVAESTNADTAQAAEPLKAAIDALVATKDMTEEQRSEAHQEIVIHLAAARTLAARAYIQNLARARDMVGEEVAKQKEGSPLHAKFKALHASYERTVHAAAKAYEAALAGNLEAFDELEKELDAILAENPELKRSK